MNFLNLIGVTNEQTKSIERELQIIVGDSKKISNRITYRDNYKTSCHRRITKKHKDNE
jgi:hypothetical protein